MKRLAAALMTAMLVGCSQPATTKPAVEAKPHSDHEAEKGESAATAGYRRSMTSMMSTMPAFTGDPDHDFMRQMRIHHVAAVEMARVELAHGKDVEARRLATEIIAAQRREIVQIDAWLKRAR